VTPPLQTSDTGAGRIAYRRGGAGAPLLLIHGWGASSRYWLGAFAALAARHDLIALDLPGFGTSPPARGRTGLATLRDAALALCDALGLERLAIAGHSLGAAVALLAAAARPAQVTRLALASFGLPRGPAEAARMAALHLQLRAGAALWSPWLALWSPWLALTQPLRAAAWSTPPMPALLAAPMVHRPASLSPAALALGAADLAAMDARAGLEAASTTGDPAVAAAAPLVRAPALVLSGCEDALFPPDAARALAAALPRAELLLLDACGHVPMAEAPARFYGALGAFVAA
jgi:pimeloyl-ACP methyl ester carboxylesterase